MPRLSFGLFVAGKIVAHAFPWREEIELPEFLIEPHGLVDDALLLVVPADLDEARHREILAQRMPLEAVIGEESPQIGMAREEYAEQVIGLTLEPVGARKDFCDRRHEIALAGLRLHAHAVVVAR